MVKGFGAQKGDYQITNCSAVLCFQNWKYLLELGVFYQNWGIYQTWEYLPAVLQDFVSTLYKM